MKQKAKVATATLLAFSYLMVLGLFTSNVDFCGCGGVQWLQSSLPSVTGVAGGWNSWLGNSWALGASSWTAPMMASASQADTRGEPVGRAPVFEEWRLEKGFAIEPSARIDSEAELRVHSPRTDMGEAVVLAMDCLKKAQEVRVVLSGIEQLDEPDFEPHVVVVTAELPKVELFQQPLATLSRTPGCSGSVKVLHRRSAT